MFVYIVVTNDILILHLQLIWKVNGEKLNIYQQIFQQSKKSFKSFYFYLIYAIAAQTKQSIRDKYLFVEIEKKKYNMFDLTLYS